MATVDEAGEAGGARGDDGTVGRGGPAGDDGDGGAVDGTPVPLAALEDEVCRLAAQLAAGTSRYLVLLAEFDARDGWAGDGVLSCAHWMSWRLGVSLSTAREQLRVARALRHLPATVEEFGRGALSYSKVRAITRIATPETEADLVQVGLTAPAAHLDRLVRGLITAADTAAGEERRTAHRRATGEDPPEPHAVPLHGLTWSWTHDGVLAGSFRFDPEDGAAFLALVRGAVLEVERADGGGDPTTRVDPTTGTRRRTGDGPPDEPGETPGEGPRADDGERQDGGRTAGGDGGGGAGRRRSGAELHRWMTPRHVSPEVIRLLLESAREGAASATGPRRVGAELVVHVDAVRLAAERAAASEGTDEGGDEGGSAPQVVPEAGAGAGTGTGRGTGAGASTGGTTTGVGHPDADRAPGALADGPGLLLQTVRRIGCDAAVRWALDGPGRSTLDQGRRTRRPGAAQLRALERRDGGCVLAGCGRRTFLHAHHVRHWADGGASDLDNLVLLCGTHHRLLHDGEFDVRALGGQRFQVVDRLGRPVDPAPALEGDVAQLVAAHAAVPPGALTPDWLGEPVRASEATGALLSWWATTARGDARGDLPAA